MEGSLLSRFLLLQWMVVLLLWNVVSCRYLCYSNGWQPSQYGRQSVVVISVTPMDGSLVTMEGNSRYFCYSIGWQPCHYGRQYVLDIFVIPIDGTPVIMEGSLLSRFLLLQWMVAFSKWKVVCCRDFCYSHGWYPCRYGRQYVLDIFVIPLDGSLVLMEVTKI